VRSGLVVAEVALSLVLLVGAGLVLRSMLEIGRVDPGIETDGRIMATTSLAPAVYGADSARVRFQDGLLRELETSPGVRRVGVVSRAPLRGSSNAYSFTVEGQGEAEHQDNPFLLTNSISPDYFRAAGLALLRGRAFTTRDDADAQPVGVVNRTMVRRYWPDDDPIGQRLKYGSPGGDGEWIRIVGVVEDVRHMNLEREPRIQLYRPYRQQPTSRLSVIAHAEGDPNGLRPALAGALEAVDPDQAFYDVMTLDAVVVEAAWDWRFFSGLFWTFGGLAALGLYGVLSYGVASRRREFGVRLALGAEPGDVMRHVMRGAARLFAIGALIGLVAGVLLNRVMASVLYEVAALDLPTFVGVLVLLAAVAAVATWLPARRATRVDPAAILRAE
jgi:putative ABC transport system permease protein